MFKALEKSENIILIDVQVVFSGECSCLGSLSCCCTKYQHPIFWSTEEPRTLTVPLLTTRGSKSDSVLQEDRPTNRFAGPLLVLYWSSAGPLMVLYWSSTGSLMAHYWSTTGPLMVLYWSSTGSLMVHYWSTTGPLMVLCWSSASPLLVLYWSSDGALLVL